MRKLSLLILILSSLMILAQEKNDSSTTKLIQEVYVYSLKKETSINNLALPFTVVPKTALENASYFTPADALQRKAGISLTRDGIWATSVNLRGLSKERLLILADNERIQTATDIAAALSTIDINSLEQIEVIKGAASVLYGTGAMGGVINFVTERPTYTPSQQINGKVSSGFNTVNNLWNNYAKIQMSNYNWYLGVNGSYRQAQDIKTPDGKLKNSQFNDASIGMQGGMTYDDTQELLINYQHFSAWDVGLPGGDAFPANATVKYNDVKRNQLSAEYIFYEPILGLKELRLKGYTQNISRNVENKLNDSTYIFPSSKNVTSGGKILTDWDLNSSSKNLYIGAEGWLRQAQTSRIRGLERGNKTTFIKEQPVPNAKMLDLGVFAQYNQVLIPQKLKLDAGIRFDYIRTKNDTAFNPLSQVIIENGHREETMIRKVMFTAGLQNEFSYSAHVDFIYTPALKHKFVLSLSNAYRTASLEERFKYIDQGSIIRLGNPNLKSEKGGFSNIEYSYSSKKLNIKADVFANYLFDMIAEQKKIGTALVDTFLNVNIGNALLIGGELEASYQITKEFWTTANVSYTRGTDMSSKNFLPQIPPLKGMIDLNYHLRNKGTASISALWAASQTEVASTEKATDGHITFNVDIRSEKLKAGRTFLQFFAGVDNLLNTSYYNHLATTRGINRLEPGRNFYAKAQFSW